ncbi:hypothetical protein KR51_00030440 [Rubidibacter lacunae KORDI 51-2]|uniref:Uncharacterized protein n=1 Tax=Rubidibacter lacunae KORDI 51-2 TaxID=582515 RepID=U5D781_9CHRO|nr:hypothetical protein KR51_00030440 [Rubidibacter lacunae KORDI 51-2]
MRVAAGGTGYLTCTPASYPLDTSTVLAGQFYIVSFTLPVRRIAPGARPSLHSHRLVGHRTVALSLSHLLQRIDEGKNGRRVQNIGQESRTNHAL